jgi:hypothetical protein
LINYITVTRIGATTSLPDLWFPGSASGGAWRQLELDERVPVGLVSIEFPVEMNKQTPQQVSTGGFLTSGAVDGNGIAVGQPHQIWPYDCRMRWLFERSGCAELSYASPPRTDLWNSESVNRPFGVFDNAASEGAVISVSDTPCTTANGCSGGTVCRRIETQYREYRGSGTYVTTGRGQDIDCGGAVGRYVRVHLPGSGRIFGAQVSVNRAQIVAQPNQMACYAVRARISTKTTPEYVTTTDPLDPIFYSTCYVRDRKITWLPSPTSLASNTPNWAFNNNTCLTCSSFRRNIGEPDTPNNSTVPLWTVASECVDCASSAPLSADVLTCAAVGGGAGGAGGGGASSGAPPVGIALGAVALVLIVAIVGFVAHRRRQGRPVNPFGKTYGKPSRFRATKNRPQPLHNEMFDGVEAVSTDGDTGASGTFTNPAFEKTATLACAVPRPNVVMPTRKPPAAPQRAPPVKAPRAAPQPAGKPVTVIEAALWEGVVDESQDPPGVYFVNASTGATQWESPLPAGWVAAVNDGKVYYLNEDSDETQWHFPIGDSEA